MARWSPVCLGSFIVVVRSFVYWPVTLSEQSGSPLVVALTPDLASWTRLGEEEEGKK